MIDPQFIHDYDISAIKKLRPKSFDFDFFVTPRFIEHYTNNTYKKHTAFLVRQNAKGINTFIDVGAHFGFFDLIVGITNPHCQIFSFEPVIENFEILKKNLALNKIDALAMNKAVGKITGNAQFELSEAGDNSGFKANPNAKVIETIEVSTIKIDDILSDIVGNSVLIKIDVEGSEIDVLEGMSAAVEKFDDIRLIIEFNPKCLLNNNREPDDLLHILSTKGFDIFFIDDSNGKFYKYQNDLNWRELIKGNNYCNLFCVKRNRSLNLCIFSHSSNLAGAERSLLQLVKDLTSTRGSLCTIVLPGGGPSISMLQEAGASTIIAPMHWWCTGDKPPNNEEINWQMGETLDWLLDTKPTFKQLHPDVIMTNTMVIPWGALAAAMLERPHLWMVNEFGELAHGLKFYPLFNDVLNFIELSSDKVITNSEAVRNGLFPEKNPEKVQTIYRYIPTQKNMKNCNESKEKWFDFQEATKILMLGSIIELKGQEDAVLSVIELIENRKHNVELVMMGYAEKQYLDHLISLINAHNMQKHIRVLPFQENIFPVLDEADIALVCSRMEAFGRVTLEAMLMKKAVVATNSGGTPELITDGHTGLLYEPGNHIQLANQIEKFITYPEHRKIIAKRAYQFASETFSKDKFVNKYSKLLYGLKDENCHRKEGPMNFLISQYQHLVEQKNMEIQKLNLVNTKLEKSKQIIQQLTADLAERDQSIQQFTAALNGREQSILQLSADLAERDQSILQLSADQAEREQSIKQLSADLAERDQSIQQLSADQAELQANIQKTKQEVLFYASSKSWRITRPLRKMVKLAKRLVQRNH